MNAHVLNYYRIARADGFRAINALLWARSMALNDMWEDEDSEANVRFDYETGERIEYYDAADASEHHLRMMGG